MRQAKVSTYPAAVRIDLGDAAKVWTAADAQGVTMSAWMARLVHEAVRKVTATPMAKAWAAERLAANTARRARVDAAVRAGRDRKPGWENTKRFRDRCASAEEVR